LIIPALCHPGALSSRRFVIPALCHPDEGGICDPGSNNLGQRIYIYSLNVLFIGVAFTPAAQMLRSSA